MNPLLGIIELLLFLSQSWWWEEKYLEVVEDMGDSDGGYNL